MALLRFVLVLAAAAVADALLGLLLPAGVALLDPWLLVVLAYGTRHPPPRGTLAGAGAGLTQDALASTLLGLHGFSKALTGYLCHAFAGKLLLSRTAPRLILAAAATLADRWTLALLQLLLGQGFAPPSILPLLLLAAGNAGATVLLLGLLDRLPGWRLAETA